MRKNSKKPESLSNVSIPPPSGTRDAVESAIDASKGDKSMTWEDSAASNLAKISRWESPKKSPSEPLLPST